MHQPHRVAVVALASAVMAAVETVMQPAHRVLMRGLGVAMTGAGVLEIVPPTKIAGHAWATRPSARSVTLWSTRSWR
jgi:hypothetical protein